MLSQTTRRFELGLPLFSGLDLGLLIEAQEQIRAKDFRGLSGFITTLGKTGASKSVRKLAAIYRATDLELKMAEVTPSVMEALEQAAAERPFLETFADAMDFLLALFASLGVSPGSFEAAPKQTTKPKKGKGASAGSPSGT